MHGKSIRLIYCGRNLNDHNTIASCRIQNGSNIHCFISEQNSNQDNDQNEEEVLRGFDRLSEMGFSEDEIEHYRMQFYLNYDLDGVDMDQDFVTLEEEWISNYISPQQVIDQRVLEQEDIRNEGNYTDLFMGMIAGFIFGLILLLWVCLQFKNI